MTKASLKGSSYSMGLKLAIVLVILALYGGYKVGKDMALRDNARDAAAQDRADGR